jgi:hypothetical protein
VTVTLRPPKAIQMAEERAYQSTIAGDIGGEDGGKAALGVRLYCRLAEESIGPDFRNGASPAVSKVGGKARQGPAIGHPGW